MKDNNLKNIRFEYDKTVAFNNAYTEEELNDVRKETSPQTKKENNFKKYRKLIILGILLIVIVVICALFIYDAVNKVQDIQINDLNGYTREEIVLASGIKNGDSLKNINAKDVARKIKAKYLDVSTVEIIKEPPRTVLIKITWSIPKYYIDVYGEHFTLDQELKILSKITDEELKEKDLIKIEIGSIESAIIGKEIVLTNEKQKETLYELIHSLSKNGLTNNVTKIDIRDIYQISFVYKKVYLVKLGNMDSIEYKIDFVSQTLKNPMFDGTKKATLEISKDMKNISVVYD